MMQSGARHCSECSKRIDRRNQSGRCKACLYASPEWRAERAEDMRRIWADAETRARKEKQLEVARSIRMAHIPDGMMPLYRHLTQKKKYKAAEAARIVIEHHEKETA